ncbi:MAG: hypothetical protein JWP91_2562 [Fibrobacteres bacterium]|nr:hypothetical protein [Fibrobacterota bacterium]
MERLLLAAGLLSMIAGCGKDPEERMHPVSQSPIRFLDSLPSSCPSLVDAGNGAVALGYVRAINDSVSIMAYSVSGDRGRTFGPPVEIAASRKVKPHGENLPRLAFKPDGEIVAAWGIDNAGPARKYSGLILYSRSTDGGKTFSEGIPLVSDTASFDQRYLDLAILPDGEVGAIWLDNRKRTSKEGSSLYFATTRGKAGFGEGIPIGETTCQCCRTDLYVDGKGGIHVAYRDIINDSIRDMVHIVSTDGGRTFSVPQRISPDGWAIRGCPHTGPAMAENRGGLHFAWFTMGGGEGVFYGRTRDGGTTFTPRQSVSANPTAKHPQIAAFGNGNVAIVWDESLLKEKGEELAAGDNRIGLQIRDPEGSPVRTSFLTSTGENASFPVLMGMDDTTLLVAYTVSAGKRNQVRYRLLNPSKAAGKDPDTISDTRNRGALSLAWK